MQKLLGLYLTVAVFLLGSLVNGHNWLDTPVSRADQRDSQTGCRYGGEGNPTCAGPCDRKVSGITIAPITTQRGAAISVKWSRHDHPGGFIRFAWSPTSSSDSYESFDAHVDHFVCKEIGGCGPASPNDSPGSSNNGQLCSTTINVPTYLTNGAWTLQWAYFGGFFNAGDYYACVDYTISGGPTGSQTTPYFTGGDYTYPNSNQCLFYSTNALRVCTAEPCLNGTFPAGAQHGAVKNVGGQQTPPPPPPATPPPATPPPATPPPATPPPATPPPATQPPATPPPATQPPATPPPAQPPVTLTTAKKVASTTHKPASLTTGAVATQPPAQPPSNPPPVPVSPPSSGAGCTLGHQECTGAATYHTCTWTSRTETGWSINQACPVGVGCHTFQDTYVWCY